MNSQSSPRKGVPNSAPLSTTVEMLQAVEQNTIKAKLREAAVAAAKAHYELGLLKDFTDTTHLEKLTYLRSLQSGLLNLSLDDKLDMEKFASLMQSAHDQYLNTEKGTQNEKMEVDWTSQKSQSQEEQKTTSQPSQQTNPKTTRHRDEFSYSLIEAIWMHRQLQIDDESEEGVAKREAAHKKIKEVLTLLMQKNVLNERQALEILEVETLGAVNLVNENAFNRKSRSFFTMTFFEQQKFNLLREENEGFSKTIIELNQGNICEDNIDIVLQNIQKLIGYFSIDPNRLLDLILSAFENNVRNLSYLTLLKEFGSKEAVTQLIGFKIQNALSKAKIGENGVPTGTSLERGEGVRQSLFDLTAILIKYEVIELGDVWVHLEHNLKKEDENVDEIESLHKKQIVSLDYQYQMLFKTIMNQAALEQEMKKERIDQKHEQIEQLRAKMHQNFKIRLLQSAIEMNDWTTADDIVHGIYEGRIDLTLSQTLLATMFKALNWLIEKMYAPLSPGGSILPQRFKPTKKAPYLTKTSFDYFADEKNVNSLRQATSPKVLFEELPKIIKILGIHIGFDEKVFLKLLKVMQSAIQKEPQFNQQAIAICGEVFLPALALTSDNYALENALWQILKLADYKQRYWFYSTMLTKTYLSHPQLIAKQISVYRQIGKWARRLDADQLRQKSRLLTKIASGNAIIAFDTIGAQAKAYDNQIETQIQAISHSQDLSLDIMAFTIVKHLADTKESTLDKAHGIATWLQNLTEFAAQFFRKYQTVEITGLLTFLVHKLRDEDAFTLGFMLNKIIAKMFGWTDLEMHELSSDKLNILAAGFVLALESRNCSQQLRTNKKTKTIDCLEKLFWDPSANGEATRQTHKTDDKLGLRLMVHLAQQAQHVLNEFDKSDQLLLIARQYDTMQKYFTHLVDTLSFLATSQKKFSMLLPENPIKTLGYDYRLPPQYTFQILRSALPHIYKLSDEALAQNVADFKQVLDYSIQSRVDIAMESESSLENDYWDELKFINTRKDDVWKILKPELYCIFWYMNIQNLVVSEQQYKDEIKKIGDQIEQVKNKRDDQSTRIPLSSSEQQKKNQKEINQLVKLQKELQAELDFKSEHHRATFAFLERRIPKLFEEKDGQAKQDLSSVLLQYCFFPRLLHSPKDALFSFQFFKLLHKLRVPNFNILHILGVILKCVVPAMYFCSEDEAQNLGIFFLELFKQLEYWSKKENWVKECQDYVGFAKTFTSDESIGHSEFQERISQGINKRFAKAMMFCFDKDPKMYMKTRCALLILHRMSPIFPNSYIIAKPVQKQLQILVDAKSEIEYDLWVLANGCNESLKDKIKTFPEHKRLLEKQAKEAAEKDIEKEREATAKKKEEEEKRGREKEASDQQAKEARSSRSVSKTNTEKSSNREVSKTPDRKTKMDDARDRDTDRRDNSNKGGARDSDRRDKPAGPSSTSNTTSRNKDKDSDARPGSDRRTITQRNELADNPSKTDSRSSNQSQQQSSASKPKQKAEEKESQRMDKATSKTTGGQPQSSSTPSSKGKPETPSKAQTGTGRTSSSAQQPAATNSRPPSDQSDPRSSKRPKTESNLSSSGQKQQQTQQASKGAGRSSPHQQQPSQRDNRDTREVKDGGRDSRNRGLDVQLREAREPRGDQMQEQRGNYDSQRRNDGRSGAGGNNGGGGRRDDNYRQSDRPGDRQGDRGGDRQSGRPDDRDRRNDRQDRDNRGGRGESRGRDYYPPSDNRYGRDGGRGGPQGDRPRSRSPMRTSGGNSNYMGGQGGNRGGDQFSPYDNSGSQRNQDGNQRNQDSRYSNNSRR